MEPFQSYYWNPESLAPEARQALADLLAAGDSPRAQEDAFRRLLQCGDPAADGIAMDQYFYAESLGRYGYDNPFAAFAADLLAKARGALRTAPVAQERANGTKIDGANYASALSVLAHRGGEDDLALIEPILRGSEDVDVLSMASMAAGRALAGATRDHAQVVARLAELVGDPRRPDDLRLLALDALMSSRAPDWGTPLARLAQDAELPFSAYAANAMAARDLIRYRPLLEQIERSWPEDAGFPADDVRRRLEGKGE